MKAYADGEEGTEEIGAGNSEKVRELLKLGTLCSDGSIQIREDGQVQHIGDPTETSIILAACQNGMEKDELNSEYTRLGELPFD